MALAAEQVVQAIADRLAGQTAAGSRVYTDRWWPIDSDDLPAIKVVTGDEEFDVRDALPRSVVEDSLDVNVRAYVKARTGIDAEMNAMASLILKAAFAPPMMYGLEPLGIDRDAETDGPADTAVVTVRLRAHIMFYADDPDTIISTP